MSKTRFIQWIVLACIGTVAACTSSEDGTVGNTELNVIVPTNAGTPDEIDILTVEYTINCLGTPGETFLDDDDIFPNEGVTLNGNLEVVDDRTNTSFDGPLPPSGNANPGFGTPRPGDGAEVWQGFMDLRPGPCTVELRARDNDGEVICTAREGFTIAADVTSKVNLVLICDVSFQAPVGMLDVDATFSFTVGNFCPDLFILNCIDSTPPLPVDGAGDPTGDSAETRCEVRFRDGDSTCGQGCDPQNCVADPTDPSAGLVCTPAPEPRVCPNGTTPCTSDAECPNGTCDLRGPQTVVSCTGGSIDCDGDPNTTETECTYNGDQLGTMFTNIASMNVPNPATFGVLCDSGSAGATLTCTAVTTDGDEDCNKTKTVEVTCPGDTPCTAYGGNAACTADANTVCRADTCNTGTCDGATNAACCDRVDVTDGLDCSIENGGLPADCQGGVCTPSNCTANTDCDDQNQCTETLSCDVGSGFCCVDGETSGCTQNDTAQPLTDGGTCSDGNADPTKGGYCLGGDCEPVECRAGQGGTDCDDGFVCTVDTCDDQAQLGGLCVNTNQADDTPCSPPAGGICFEINGPSQPSECLVTECAVDGDCAAGTACQGAPTCDRNIAGGTCVYASLPAGTRCPSTQDPTTCISGFCGECDGAGTCNEKPLSCDPVFRDIATCQSRELLALDCQLLGSGAPLVLDATATPAGAAVQGVPLDINPQLVLNLPASLVCGFASVVPEANVFDSIANLNLVNSSPASFPLNSFLGSIPHGPVNFDFNVGCGNQAGSCVGGLCNDTAIECTTATEKTDCQGTGAGVIVPFISTTAPDTITPAINAPFVGLQYSVADLGAWVEVPALTATLCLGDLATVEDSPTDQCSFTCIDSDRTDGGNIGGEDSPRVIYDGLCDKLEIAACGGTECPNGLDAECPLNAAGQTCNTVVNLCNPVNEANSNLGGADFCQGATEGTCDIPAGAACLEDADCAAPSSANTSGGTCVDEAPGVCPDTVTPCSKSRDCFAFSESQGIPVCCGDKPGGGAFNDFSQAANVCATGEPGSALADTQAPCNGNEDPRSQRGKVCRGAATCGSCTPVTGTGDGMPAGLGAWPTAIDSCSAVIGFGEAGYCSGTAALSFFLCPNGDSDCRNADGTGIGGLGEDYCVVPCATCNAADCCQYMQDRFPSATTAQFPLIPVNAP